MPSSYTPSLRLTLQATGENNNTWGVILNTGVFGLVDYAIAGRLAFALSGSITLTTALGATDQARAAMLDATGGSGGQIVLPAVSKGYFVRNATSGQVSVTAGGALNALFDSGDAGPCFSDGANTYPMLINNQTVKAYIVAGDAAVKSYVDAAISQGNVNLPPAAGNLGKALMVRNVGAPAAPAWVSSAIQAADVAGLVLLSAPQTWTATQFFQGNTAAAAMRLVSAVEVAGQSGAGLSGLQNFDCALNSIFFNYAGVAGAFQLNFRGSATTPFANYLAPGDFTTVTFIAFQGANTSVLSQVQIDGTTTGVTTVWQGGAAPAAAVANSYSIYTFAIRNGGTAYQVFASFSRFGP